MSTTSTPSTPTTSTLICSKCGGAIRPPRDYPGRACTCASPGASASALTDAGQTAAGHKFCCVCGSDVTHARRMKDHSGRYWCYDCGAADQMKKGKAISITCHDCKRALPPALVLKHGEDYVCKDCLEKRRIHGRRHAKHGSSGQPSQALGFGVGFGIVMILAGVALIAMYYMDML